MALVDDDQYNAVTQHRWRVRHTRTKKYATAHIYRNGKRTTLAMHQLVMGEIPKGMEVDHKNGNGLDNRRQMNNHSGFKGVSANSRGRWRASIVVLNKTRRLGDYDTEIEAAHAYDKAALEAFGEFANLNFAIPES